MAKPATTKKPSHRVIRNVTKVGVLVALTSVVLATDKVQLWPGQSKDEAKQFVSGVSDQREIKLTELIRRIRGLGATGIVIHGHDVLFTDAKYQKGTTTTDYGATVLMRVSTDETADQISKALGKGKKLNDEGRYFPIS